MSGYAMGWPAGDPVERWTEREARIESIERATELRGRFGDSGELQVYKQQEPRKGETMATRLLLPTADELLAPAMQTPAIQTPAIDDADDCDLPGASQRQAIIFDIETGPLPEDVLRAMFEPPAPFDPDSVKTGNIKDPAKIAAKVAECREAHEAEGKAAEARFFERAALAAHTGEVLAIGVRFAGEKECVILGGNRENGGERALLESFWLICEDTRASDNRLVGFNVFGFDLPFLLRRSWLAGIRPPHWIMDRDRYWSPVFVDLMARWQCGDRQSFIGLDRLSKLLGVGAKNGDGARFAELLKSDKAAALAYLQNDLDLTLQVAKRLGVVG